MSEGLHARAKKAFLAACGQPAEERVAFARRQCGAEPALLREVLSLLDFSRDEDLTLPTKPTELAEDAVPNYRLLRKIGEGGMGDVWEAEQLRPLRRRVALKILKAGLETEQFLERFESERQILASLAHPGIATVFDAGSTDDGRPYFALEFVDGSPITDYCHEHSLSLRERLELFARICRGVEHAHTRGIIHRDLKPSNLLVTELDGRPIPKIIDFGVAKALSGEERPRALRTAPGDWIGTPEYMSPEQAELTDETLDGRTDVYSLGVVLYELLAGSRPFESETDSSGFDEIRRRIAEEVPTEPSARLKSRKLEKRERHDVSQQVPAELDRVTLKALARDKSERYASPREFADDIGRFLAGQGVLAPGPSFLSGWAHWTRKNRAVVTTLAVIAVVLGVVTIFRSARPVRPPRSSVTDSGSLALPASIAVLPFVNMSDDPADDYLADGLSEELLNSLARTPGLRVAARTSSFAFKGKNEDVRAIGRKLGVGRVLEGSVRRNGEKLKVTTQLIDAESGYHLWSQTFDRKPDDLFDVQEGIADAVAKALETERVEPGNHPPTEGRQPASASYDLYLQGRHLLQSTDPDSLEEAARLFERAIELDPGYARAYAGLADTQVLLSRFGNVPMAEARDKATNALQRALELDNQLADAHASLGFFWLDRKETKEAETALRRAIELNPNHAQAHLWLGHALANRSPEKASAAYQTASTLDPLNPRILTTAALNRTQAGDYDGGIALLRRTLQVSPRSAESYRLMAITARIYGRLDDAVRWAHDSLRLGPNGPLNANEVALAYAALGDTAKAMEYVDIAVDLGANNLWVPAIKSGVLLRGHHVDEHLAFTDRLWRKHPPPGSGPLTPADRVLLVLAARSKGLEENWSAAAALYERALGDPPTAILETSFDLPTLVSLAFCYRELGATDKMQQTIDLAWDSVGKDDWLRRHLLVPDIIAILHWLEGDRATAIETLVAAEAAGWTGWGFYGLLWTEFREETGFRELESRIKARLSAMGAAVSDSQAERKEPGPDEPGS